MPDYKYNPGFALDRDLIKSFVVRRHDLDLILDVAAENADSLFNRHALVIAPRGLGKTTLVRTVAAVVRQEPDRAGRWYPVIFGEESYSVGSAGELWLECIYHIQNQETESQLVSIYYELRKETDDRVLQERAIHELTKFSRQQDRKLLVIVENLNLLFDHQLSTDDGWAIRYALQNNPRLMILGTATTSFDQIEDARDALFGQFKLHYLAPLDRRDARTLWKHISGQDISDRKIRPVQILTGGNPRLIRIWAEFVAEGSFKSTIDRLGNIVDEYTDYFKAQLDSLPPVERRIFVAVLELWDPSTTREISEQARVPINNTSVLLSRLQKRGMVLRNSAVPPRWQVAERLFNIYYLMRRRGTASSRVQALVRFITVYYEGEQLVERTTELAHEACALDPEMRRDHYAAFVHLVEHLDVPTRELVLERVPGEFLAAPDLPASLKAIHAALQQSPMSARPRGSGPKREFRRVLRSASRLIDDNQPEAAEKVLLAWEATNPPSYLTRLSLATAATAQRKLTEAEQYARSAIKLDGDLPGGWFLLGQVLRSQAERQPEAIGAFRRAAALDPGDAVVWEALGSVLSKNRSMLTEAYAALRKATKLNPSNPDAWTKLGKTLDQLGRHRQAEAAFKKAIRLKDTNITAWGFWGDYSLWRKHDLKSAEKAYRKILELRPNNIRGLLRLAGVAAHFPERKNEVGQLYEQAIALSAGEDITAHLRFSAYLNRVGEREKADEILRRARASAPNDPELWLSLARLSEDGGHAEAEVESLLRRAVEVADSPSPYWQALARFLEKQSGRDLEVEKALENARLAAPKECSPLYALGSFYTKRDRRLDAEDAFRSAIELNPNCPCAVIGLATCMGESGERAPELLTFARNAVAQDPNNSAAHFVLGKQLWLLNHDFSGARAELIKALQLGGPLDEICDELASIILNANMDTRQSEKTFKSILRQTGNLSAALNTISWKIHEAKRAELLTFARELSYRAVQQNPEFWAFKHTLASILVDLGETKGTLDIIEELASNVCDSQLGDFIELCVKFARVDDINGLLNALQNSTSANQLEPLLTALHIVQGEKVDIAEEVRQVADDLVHQIKGCQR